MIERPSVASGLNVKWPGAVGAAPAVAHQEVTL